MFVRQLDYLLTLARERHFARAAESCCVSQPALSSAIRHLEQELGITIVLRGQRFQGFTQEGERLLGWARQTLAAWEGLRQEASLGRTQLTGTLRIGAIPTAMPVVSLLTGPCFAANPGISQVVRNLANEEIIRRLDEFDLDLGLTYLEDQALEGFRVLPLYREHYMLVARDVTAIGSRTDITWREAAELPLCLLTQNMQNRRIVNAAFRRAGVKPHVVVESDSIFALSANVQYAGLCSIVPHSLLCVFPLEDNVAVIRIKPRLTRSIGLIALDQDPAPPLQAAAWNMAQRLDLQSRFDDHDKPWLSRHYDKALDAGVCPPHPEA